MSPAEKEARQMIADKKLQEASGRAYDRASSLPMAVEKTVIEKVSPKRSPAVEEAIQEVQDAKMRKRISDMGYSKGGKVSSASRRADGIAERGKTKGKFV